MAREPSGAFINGDLLVGPLDDACPVGNAAFRFA
jgi:hypothetical protein